MISGLNLQRNVSISPPLYHVLKEQLHGKTQEELVESTAPPNKHLD